MTGGVRLLTLRNSGGRFLVAALTVLALALLVACDDDDEDGGAGSIEVSNARAQFTTTDLGAVYFDLRSTGVGDVLLAASAEIADDTQVHEVVTEGSSAIMREVDDGIVIDPGGHVSLQPGGYHVSLQPGGYHVMLLGVEEIPEIGSTFELVLEFERAGRMTVIVRVQEFGGDGGSVDHGDMEMEGEKDEGEMDGEEPDHE